MNNQDILTNQILQASLKVQAEKGPDLRQLHPKSHGLLHGEFKVRDDIPDEYKIGVFAQPQTYPIWVRFSNGSSPKERGVFKPDTEGDVRGMAIKLMMVKGDKVLDDEKETQDFILINHHVFFLPDVQGYLDLATFNKAREEKGIDPANQGQLAKLLTELNLEKLRPSLAILAQINGKVVGNPLLIQYWSTTPYKLGSHKIKFSAKPRKIEQSSSVKPDSPNYLREAIVKYFDDTEESVKFDFEIQVYIDEEKTPIENSMVEWTEAKSYTVATIEIPKQQFDFEERKRYDESLSFSPWHTLHEQEPLGSVNLARKKIYHEGAKHRREYIQERLREPQPYQSLHDDPQQINNIKTTEEESMSNTTDTNLTTELMPNLYVGCTGADVEKLQRKLQELEFYSGPIDGLFGLGVEQAVKEYEDSQGFAADGVAGVFVLEALGLLTIERDRLE